MSKGYLKLTPFAADLFSVLYTLSYVGVLYLSPLTRPRAGLPRDTPFVIRSRIRAVTVVTIVAILLSCSLIILTTPRRTWHEVASLLGLSVGLSSTLDIFRCFLLTAVLFTGPLLQRLWFEDDWRALTGDNEWRDLRDGLGRIFTTWVGWRNYVAGPFTEEVVFRACLVPLHLIVGRSPGRIVFISPLFFGLAHIHHAYEFYLNHPGAISAMVVRTLFQFIYTTLFGWFATFVFLRTGSVWAVIATHSFCNFMGVPHLGLVDGPRWRSMVYVICLFGGAWGFKRLLWPLTRSSNALAYME